MKWRLLIASLVACYLLTICHAQEAPRRPVTINVTQGEPIKGEFVRADESTVTIRSGVAETTIKIEDIKSIVFEGMAPAPTPPPPGNKAAQDAVSALRKLASATEVGVSYVEYNRILIEAKAEVDGLLPKITDATTRASVEQTMRDYVYAQDVWGFYVRNRGSLSTKSDMGRTLINEYGVPTKPSVWTSIDRYTALSYVWRRARLNYERAKALAGQ